MVDLHKLLVRKNKFYASWHRNPLHILVHWGIFLIASALVTTLLLTAISRYVEIDLNRGRANTAPGGFVEKSNSAVTRQVYTATQLAQFVPTTRSVFTFPAPYGTQAYRITIPADCGGGTDCVDPVGYAFWRNMSNSAGSNTIYMFINLIYMLLF